MYTFHSESVINTSSLIAWEPLRLVKLCIFSKDVHFPHCFIDPCSGREIVEFVSESKPSFSRPFICFNPHSAGVPSNDDWIIWKAFIVRAFFTQRNCSAFSSRITLMISKSTLEAILFSMGTRPWAKWKRRTFMLYFAQHGRALQL